MHRIHWGLALFCAKMARPRTVGGRRRTVASPGVRSHGVAAKSSEEKAERRRRKRRERELGLQEEEEAGAREGGLAGKGEEK